MVLFFGSAAAAPGDLDPSFGNGGEAEAAISSAAIAEDLAVQPDGKIVVAGSSNYGLALARFNADGSLDSGFGSGGTVGGPTGPYGVAFAVAIQADGKILAGGWSADGTMAVVRFTANGSVDESFGVGGVAAGPPGVVRGLEVQPNGKIVLAGSGPDPVASAHENVLLLRFDPDGTPDAGFGSNGVVRTRIGADSDAWALALQADNKILVAGRGGDFKNVMAVARYEPDGQLDPTFGTAGVMTATPWWATAIGVEPDGRIVVAGSADRGLAVMRLRPDGAFDPTFGSNGTVTIGTGGLRGAWDLALQSDGHIVVGAEGPSVFTLVRLGIGGEVDPSFGQDGISRTSFGFWSEARAIALQPDGRILAAGFNSHESETHFAVARYRVASPSTIEAAPVIVRYGRKVRLEGTAADPRPGTLVRVLGRDCFAYSTARLGVTKEDSVGAWTAAVTPRARTGYRAQIDGDRSVPVDVQVSPRVRLRRISRTRVQVRVTYGHSLEGETIELQRFRDGSGWVRVRFRELRRLGRARDGIVSSATLKAAASRGPIRAYLEQPNPYACYATAVSRPIPR